MIKNTFLILIVLGFSSLNAQEVFLKAGKNNTTYDFSSPNSNAEIAYRSGSGNFYEIGCAFDLNNNNLAYAVSITYNQFNAAANYQDNNYTWATNYIGIQNSLSYKLYESSNIKASIIGGVNTSTLTSGEQFINTSYFDITDNEEFAGIILQPLLGAIITYSVSEKLSLSLGYNYSKAFNISNRTDEKTTFNTSQLQLGIYIPIN